MWRLTRANSERGSTISAGEKNGVWVFGGIERETKNCFLTSVEDRSADTLVPIIKQHVLPGTIIISDCWKAYSRLTEEGYVHQTVNHSKEFVNRETGAHINTIESTGLESRQNFVT